MHAMRKLLNLVVVGQDGERVCDAQAVEEEAGDLITSFFRDGWTQRVIVTYDNGDLVMEVDRKTDPRTGRFFLSYS
jgi:fructose-1,6-bisphosphatase/inositol monophosphatase family enzyme